MERLDPSALWVLRAVAGTGLLTLVMLCWMGATRLPAMRRLRLGPDAGAHTAQLRAQLPSEVQRVADNYNHLFEAPTVFYAIALLVAFAGLADPLHAICAWAFLLLRVAHSVVQATVNRVALRFLLFALSWVALGVMIVRALLQLL